MGRSRQRKNAARMSLGQTSPQRQNREAHIAGTLVIDPATSGAECPGAVRLGLDLQVIQLLKDVDRFVADMRKDIAMPDGGWNEDIAVKRYLIYLSVLVDVMLADMVMSAVHSNDMMTLMKMRMLVEYAAKALYYDRHPEYALWAMTIGEANDVLKKLTEAQSPASDLQDATRHRDSMVAMFPGLAGTTRRTVADIMREVAGASPHVWLYRAPSALIHGDPEGLRSIMEVDKAGNQTLRIDLDVAHLNALLVDGGMYTLTFCECFIDRFHPADQMLRRRYAALSDRVHTLVLKHNFGRTRESLAELKLELEPQASG